MRLLSYLGAFAAVQAVAGELNVDEFQNRNHLKERGEAMMAAIKNKDPAMMAKQVNHKDLYSTEQLAQKNKKVTRLNGNGPVIRSPHASKTNAPMPLNERLKLTTPLSHSESRALLEKLEAHDRELHTSHYHNNFVEVTTYDDHEADCGWEIEGVGWLVNFCFKYEDDFSVMLKTNLRDNVLVQLDWKNGDCAGVPSKVWDLFDRGTYMYDFCIGGTTQISYTSEWTDKAGVYWTWSEENVCDQGLPYYYYWANEWYCFNDGTDSWYYMTDTCNISGEGPYYHYIWEGATDCMSGAMTWHTDDTYECLSSDTYDYYYEVIDGEYGRFCKPYVYTGTTPTA